jgi:PelA/Pel-15E family pectate lyase
VADEKRDAAESARGLKMTGRVPQLAGMELPALLHFTALATLLASSGALAAPAPPAQTATAREEITAVMRKAAGYFRANVATRGGYLYYYLPDLSRRWGEGEATPHEIWVQRPGTPAVGLAFLRAYAATKDRFYLEAATDAARALVQGQLVSGGWTNSIDFNATGKNAARYRKLAGGPRNQSSLDDGITQHALRLVMRVDQVLAFRDAEIHEASEYARAALLKAQFANGGFPQGWTEAVAARPVAKAAYPEYEWRTENRIKNYWDLPTLNDDLALHLAATLEDAWSIYKDEPSRAALAKLGDFLLLAQMPDPQPGWAQQYDFQMRPVWARRFEPPAIAGRESQGALLTLLAIHRVTQNAKYLEPIPRALEYLKRSLLPNGQLARYYELKTNRPLYMTKDYQLTYDDTNAPAHYGWKTDAKLDAIGRRYEAQRAGNFEDPEKTKRITEEDARAIARSLDAEGRWVSTYHGESLVGQPKFSAGLTYLSSEVFAENLEQLSAFLAPAE